MLQVEPGFTSNNQFNRNDSYLAVHVDKYWIVSGVVAWELTDSGGVGVNISGGLGAVEMFVIGCGGRG